MKRVFLVLVSLFLCGVISFASAQEYMSEMANGKIKFEVTYNERKDYVEVFIKKNEVQILAKSITNSVKRNSDGTYSYHLIHDGYVAGDMVVTRFYSHANGVQTFTPTPFAPGYISWGRSLIYTNPAGGSPYITELPNGKALFKLKSQRKDYVEVSVRKNGVQMITEDITDNYSYDLGAYSLLDTGYVAGDKIEVSFYTRANDVEQYTPGRTEQQWSKHDYGTYGNPVLVTADATYTIGSHVQNNGAAVHTEVYFDIGFDYLTPTPKTSEPAKTWLVDRALAQSFNREYFLQTVKFEGMYVRHCRSGKWININNTVYAPVQSPLLLGGRTFSLNHYYSNTLSNVLLDTNFSCPDVPPKTENVLLNGVPQHVLARGRVHFAYVVQHQ